MTGVDRHAPHNNNNNNIINKMNQETETALVPQNNKTALSAICQQLNLSNEGELYGILKRTIMPTSATDEQIGAFCIVCAQRGLNPLSQEIYAFPNKQGGISPMIGIDGWLKLIHSNPDFDGMTHQYAQDGTWVECTIHSKTHPQTPTVIREYLAENNTNSPMWKQRPMRMLRHRATIQAIRYFGNYSGVIDLEEVEADKYRATDTKQNPMFRPAPAVRNVTPQKPEPDPLPEPEPDCPSPELFDMPGQETTYQD